LRALVEAVAAAATGDRSRLPDEAARMRLLRPEQLEGLAVFGVSDFDLKRDEVVRLLPQVSRDFVGLEHDARPTPGEAALLPLGLGWPPPARAARLREGPPPMSGHGSLVGLREERRWSRARANDRGAAGPGGGSAPPAAAD
jgi:hypothetical protein